jgi:hypothetical protein
MAHTCDSSCNAWEAEIGKIEVRGQPGQIVHETPPLPPTLSKITTARKKKIGLKVCKKKKKKKKKSTLLK